MVSPDRALGGADDDDEGSATADGAATADGEATAGAGDEEAGGGEGDAEDEGPPPTSEHCPATAGEPVLRPLRCTSRWRLLCSSRTGSLPSW